MTFENGICLITDNVPKLVGFYEKVLKSASEGDDIHSEFRLGSGSLAIYSKAAAIQDMGFNFDKYCGTGMFTFGFIVDDVDSEFERLKAELPDIEIVAGPKTYPWGARALHFRDPDGNIIYFRKIGY